MRIPKTILWLLRKPLYSPCCKLVRPRSVESSQQCPRPVCSTVERRGRVCSCKTGCTNTCTSYAGHWPSSHNCWPPHALLHSPRGVQISRWHGNLVVSRSRHCSTLRTASDGAPLPTPTDLHLPSQPLCRHFSAFLGSAPSALAAMATFGDAPAGDAAKGERAPELLVEGIADAFQPVGRTRRFGLVAGGLGDTLPLLRATSSRLQPQSFARMGS